MQKETRKSCQRWRGDVRDGDKIESGVWAVAWEGGGRPVWGTRIYRAVTEKGRDFPPLFLPFPGNPFRAPSPLTRRVRPPSSAPPSLPPLLPLPTMPDPAQGLAGNKRRLDDPNGPHHPPAEDTFITDHDAAESGGDDDDDDEKPKSDKKAGRRKIKIEFIQDKSRRHITFSKRKAGIMKKVRTDASRTPCHL